MEQMSPAGLPGGAGSGRPKVTYTQLRAWSEGQDLRRWELVDGEPFAMSGASVSHQAISGELYSALKECFQGSACQVFFAPLDVRFSEYDVTQPDLLVVCDPSQLKETYVEGPPALVVEILSPSSLRHDRIRKLRVYAQYGVPEYWLIGASPPMAEVLVLDGATYRVHGSFHDTECLTSPNFPELKIALSSVLPPLSDDIVEVREAAPPYPFEALESR